MSRDRFTGKDENCKWAVRLSEDCQMTIEYSELVNNDGSKTCTPVFVYAPFVDQLAEYEDLIFSPEVLQAIIKEWKEWADAKNDGRLLILPCKEGDPVYQLNGPCAPIFGTCPYDGGYGTYRCGPPERCKPYIEEMKFSLTMMPHFGRIYFKTKEEAKKALEERYGK